MCYSQLPSLLLPFCRCFCSAILYQNMRCMHSVVSHLFFYFVAVRLLRLPLVSTAAGVGPPLTYMHQPWSLEILIFDSQAVSVLRWNWTFYLWKHVHRPHAMFDFLLSSGSAFYFIRYEAVRKFCLFIEIFRVSGALDQSYPKQSARDVNHSKAKLQSLSTTPLFRCF